MHLHVCVSVCMLMHERAVVREGGVTCSSKGHPGSQPSLKLALVPHVRQVPNLCTGLGVLRGQNTAVSSLLELWIREKEFYLGPFPGFTLRFHSQVPFPGFIPRFYSQVPFPGFIPRFYSQVPFPGSIPI